MSFLVLFVDYKIYTLPSFSHFSVHIFASRKQKAHKTIKDGIYGFQKKKKSSVFWFLAEYSEAVFLVSLSALFQWTTL
jgi:hypothetical protein